MGSTDVEQEQGGRCPECGQALPLVAKFCLECGTRLAVEPEREARKTVTAVFADVVGSTPLQERIDAEAAHHVMERFYRTMRDVLEAHDGRVAKFIGDAVVAIFGVPAVREDDALRAVQAAGAMGTALAALNDQLERDWGVRIGMRMGVNTGEVVISPEGLAIGDAMNVAARLEQYAGDGEVLLGETTYRHVRHAARCEPIEPLTLKGKSEPVPAFRLLYAPPTGGQQRARIEAPLIGRDAELLRLVEAFETAVLEQTCRLVTVVGSPGLGKTRLAEELAATLADRATVVQGRCEPTGEGITFLPVAEVLRGAAQIGEADEPAVVRSKLAALLPGDPDVELLVERAGGLLGFAKPATAEETFWSVRRLLGGLARVRPLVVVLDDVHWGQPTFLDLVEHLAEWGRQAPILLLALARPELRDLRPALTEPGQIAADVVELVPLGDEHCLRLVHELLDRADVPEGLAGRVLETTGGNPLFLGETLRMFVDDGVLRREGDGWVATIDADDLEVPPTISALLAARIERLDADERSVVERAAVIGKQFYRGAVADLAPTAVADGIDSHLTSLGRKEVVEPDGSMWLDEPVFRFHHVLIRDAAYRTLLKDARAELHERFADWLTDKAGELVGEHEEVIAFHLEQAHAYRRELGPLDARGVLLGERAVALLHATGRRALEREDLPAATNLLGRAAGVLDDASVGAADVLIDLLETLLSAGQAEEAATAADRLRGLQDHGERPAAWAVIATSQLAQLTDSTGLKESLSDVARAGEVLAAAGDDAGQAKAHHVRAQGLALLGQVAEVEAALDQALAAARRAGDTRRATAVLSGAPRAALWGPSPVMRSSGRCLDVVRILRMAQGNRHVEAIALRCQAVLEAMRGRTDAARQILDRCRMTLEELGLRLELLETEQYAGIVELVAGDHAAAEERLRIAHEGFAARRLDVGAAAAAALLARAVVEQDRFDEAFALTQFSEEHGRENLKTTIAWCSVRARVLAARGEHAEAETLAARAVALADGTDALVDHGDARLDLARVLRAAGKEERARSEALRAAELYEAKGHEAGAERAAAFADEKRHREELVEADALPQGMPAGHLGLLVGEIARAISERDEDALWAGVTDDVVVLDRRPVAPRGDTRDAEGFVRFLRSFWDASDDLLARYTQLVEAGELGLGYHVYSGHDKDGGGAFISPMLIIARSAGQRVDHFEILLPEDERAALDRLLELHPDADERTAWSSVLDAMVDHNERKAPETPYADAYAGLPQGRMSVEIVATAGAQAVMSRVFVEAETPVERGQIVSLEDGVAVGVELFDAGDGAAMRARFAELVGLAPEELELIVSVGTPPTGLPAGSVVDVIRGHSAAFNERNEDKLRAVVTDDVVILDRRPVSGRGDTHDVDGYLRSLLSLMEASDDLRLLSTGFVEAGDLGTGLQHYVGHSNDGGGAFVIPIFVVFRVAEGRLHHVELYNPEQERAALDRLLELHPDAEERTAWSSVLGAMHDFNEGKPDAPYAAAYAGLPRGRMSVEIIAAAGARAVMARVFVDAVTPVALGQVVRLQDGVAVGVELFEAAEDAAMRARFAELAGERSPERREPAAVRALARCRDAYEARDWSALHACFAPDFLQLDHRPATGWSDVRSAEAEVEIFRSFVEVIPDISPSFECIMADDEVAVTRWLWRGHAGAAEGGGPLEDGFLVVLTVRGEQLQRLELHPPEADIEPLRARAEELRPLAHRRSGTGLPDEPRAAERWMSHMGMRLNAAGSTGDWNAVREMLVEDFHTVDHRTVKTLGDEVADGREAFIAREASAAAITRDLTRSAELIAASGSLTAVIIEATGRLLEGEGRFELPVGVVLEWRDGRAVRMETFEPDDEAGMLARFAELDGAGEELDRAARAQRRAGASFGGEVTSTERVTVRFLAARNEAARTGDWSIPRAQCADDLVVVDHRSPPTMGDIAGADDYTERDRSLAASTTDVAWTAEVFAAGETHLAGVGAVRGNLIDGGGPFDMPFGCVMALAGGFVTRIELFEADDEAAVLARYAELEAVRERGGVEAVLGRVRDTVNARDWTALEACFAPEFALLDRRTIQLWEDVIDADGITDFFRSFQGMFPDFSTRFELIEGDDEVGCVHWTWCGTARDEDGGGPMEEDITMVHAVRHGVDLYTEVFAPDTDVELLRARAEQLRPLARRRPGTGLPDEPLPSEHWILRAATRIDDAGRTGDWDPVRAILAEDFATVDHRVVKTLGDELADGREGFIAREMSLAALVHDVDRPYELIAASDRLTACSCVVTGHMIDGGGPFELHVGILNEWRDRLGVRIDVFDADDEAGMLARFAELDAEAPRSSAGMRIYERHADAFKRRDWDEVGAWMCEDFMFVERRPATGWSVVRGRDEMLGIFRDLLTMSPDLELFQEFVEGDDEVAIIRWGWHGHAAEGGGLLEDLITHIQLIRDEQVLYIEGYPADHDPATLRARAEELRPLARRRPGADLPDEPLPVERWLLRIVGRLDAAGGTGEWDSVRSMLAEDFRTVDHRTIKVLDGEDAEAFIEGRMSIAASTRDLRRPYELIAASDRLAACSMKAEGRLIDGDGPFELADCILTEWRDGRVVRQEFFDRDDEAGMLVRFAELEGAAESHDLGPASRVVERWVDRLSAHDLDGMRDRMTEDSVWVDHRPVSPIGDQDREGHLERIGSMFEVSADARGAIHRHIAEIDGVWLGNIGWAGHYAEGGGAFEIPLRTVCTTRDERLSGIEAFEIDDEPGALRAMMRRLGALNDAGPGTELVLRLADALAVRDWERAGTCFSADLELVDHRRVATFGVDEPGGEGFVRRVRALVDVAADAQPVVEPLAELDGAVMMTVGWSGHMDDGGGPFVLRWRGVVQVRAGLAVRYELFDEDDETGMLGAVARLRERVGPATRVARELVTAMSRRDWAGTLARLAPECEIIDGRRLSVLGSATGREVIVERAQSLIEVAADAVITFEPLDERDAVAAGFLQWTGHFDEGGGAFELRWLGVVDVRDGLVVRYEFFDEDDEAGMRARFAELEAGGGAALDVVATIVDALNARDWDALGACHTDDGLMADRRLAAWDEVRGRRALVEHCRSFVELSPDSRVWVEPLESDDEVAVFRFCWSGHRVADVGGGAFADATIMIGVLQECRLAYCEVHPEDADLAALRSRTEELRPLARRRPGTGLPDEPLPAERLAMRLFDTMQAAGRTGEWDALAALLAMDCAMVDYRKFASWGEEIRDRDDLLATQQALAASSTDLTRRYEVLAANDTWTAGIAVNRGRMVDGGGPFDISNGLVIEWRGGLAVRGEFFDPDPDDEAGMLARFAQLEAAGGGPATREMLEVVYDAVTARDWDVLDTCYAEDFLNVDRRLASWDEIRGRRAMVEHIKSVVALAPDVQVVSELLEGDDEVGVLRWDWSGHATADLGGGAFADVTRMVVVLRGGLVAHLEVHPEDADRAALRARAEELRPLARRRPGVDLPDEPLPAERWTPRLADALDACAWDRARTMLAPDLLVVDRRAVSMLGEACTRDHFIAAERSMAESSKGLRRPYEVLAARPNVIAAITLAEGELEDGGTFELPVGFVFEFQAGIARHIEFFDGDDEAGMLARFAELEAEVEEDATLAIASGVRDALNAHDWDALRVCYAEDMLNVDRRPAGWPDVHGPDGMVEHCRSFMALAPDAQAWFERIQSDDEVGVVRWCWSGHATVEHGGGAFDDATIMIIICREGLGAYCEVHPEDAGPAAMRARAEELRPLARRRPGIDLPAEPLPSERWTLRLLEAFDRAPSSPGGWDESRALMAPDFRTTDHRSVPTLNDLTTDGREEFIARERSLSDISTELQRPYEVLAASSTLAVVRFAATGRMAEGDGPFELMVGAIGRYRDGVVTSIELFEYEDEAGMLARFAELEAGGEPQAVEALLRRICDASNARDWATLEAGFADDFVLVDRRSIRVWEDTHGPAAMGELFRSFLTMLPNVVDSVDGVQGDDEVGVVHYSWRGRAPDDDGGGRAEDTAAMVWVVRDGRSAHGEVFEPDTDVEQLWARAEELRPLARRRAGLDLPDEPLAAEQLTLRFTEALNEAGRTGVWDHVRALLAPDFRLEDHRTLPTMELEGREEFIARETSWAAITKDVTRPYEVHAAAETLLAGSCVVTGEMIEGGGPFELHLGTVLQWRDGGLARLEFFEPDDESAVLARFAELAAGGSAEGAPVVARRPGVDLHAAPLPPERWVLQYFTAVDEAGRTGRWEEARVLLAPDFVLVDHRALAVLGDVGDRDGFIASDVSAAASVEHVRRSGEILAASERRLVFSGVGRGTLIDGGGPFELHFAAVVEVCDGVATRVEFFDPEDEAAMLARFAELEAGAEADNAVARFHARFAEAFNARDWPAMAACFAGDLVVLDHRPATGWPRSEGAGEVEAMWRHLLTMSEDLVATEEVIEGDDEVGFGRGTWRGHAVDGGGELEIGICHVSVLRDGLAIRGEFLPADTPVEALRARGETLRPLARRRPGSLPDEPLPTERWHLEVMDERARASVTGDWAGYTERLAPDLRVLDHRLQADRSSTVGRSDARRPYELFAASATHTASLVWVSSHGEGTFEAPLPAVTEWRDGVIQSYELFDSGDEAAMLARFHELAA